MAIDDFYFKISPMKEDDIKKIIEENKRLKRENQDLIDLIAQLRRKQYGASSEKVSSEQLGTSFTY